MTQKKYVRCDKCGLIVESSKIGEIDYGTRKAKICDDCVKKNNERKKNKTSWLDKIKAV